jgi:hypothetical protein
LQVQAGQEAVAEVGALQDHQKFQDLREVQVWALQEAVSEVGALQDHQELEDLREVQVCRRLCRRLGLFRTIRSLRTSESCSIAKKNTSQTLTLRGLG